MTVEGGNRAGPNGSRRTQPISYAEVRRAAEANGLTVEAVLALIGRTDDRYVVDLPDEDGQPAEPEPASAGGPSGARSPR
jgi:hypothetical protein